MLSNTKNRSSELSVFSKSSSQKLYYSYRAIFMAVFTQTTFMAVMISLFLCTEGAGFSSYHGEFRLPLVLAQASPIFHSSCEGKLGIALE